MGRVGVVGMGVVGSTIAAALEEAGVATRCYDPNLGIGAAPDLADCDTAFVCVPTPPGAGGALDVSAVWDAAGTLEGVLAPGSLVATKSTIPPGTTERLARDFRSLEFAVVPEFLVASRTLETFTRPDRVVIGASSQRAAERLAELMSRATVAAPIVVVRPLEAELIKVCSNAMLAAKVTMANELAGVCAAFGVSWPRVQAVVGLDRRIGPDHLTVTPERGFGGACLPKDLDGLVAAAEAAGYEPTVLREIGRFNREIRAHAEHGCPDRGQTPIPAREP